IHVQGDDIASDGDLLVDPGTIRVTHDTAYEGDSLLALARDAGDWKTTVQRVSDVSNGTLTIFDDGTFKYKPDAGYLGGDRFTYYLMITVPSAGEIPSLA